MVKDSIVVILQKIVIIQLKQRLVGFLVSTLTNTMCLHVSYCSLN